MNRKMKQEKLAKQISLALMAGMVTYTPVAFGMPVQDGTAQGVQFTTPNTVTMNITGDNQNNVINWIDFSIGKDETVNFTNTNNYANIVTGSATSFIDGHMNGGGDIYLINPNGVIFGKDAQVNVGNLYVSTQGGLQDKSYADVAEAVASPVVANVASDVVNLGTIQANKVEVVGNNIRFLNAENITTINPDTSENDPSRVKISANGYIHVGHEGGMPDSGYTANKTITEYQLVKNLAELGDISNGKNYMLANDIDGEGVAVAPISSLAPTEGKGGNFDGMFYEIKNLNISGGTTGNGLFATASNGRIENIGLRNVKVTDENGLPTGGLVGKATNETIKNVYNTGAGSVTGDNEYYVGAIVGQTNGTVNIIESYNTVDTDLGVVVGRVDGTLSIRDSYNTAATGDYGFISVDGYAQSVTIENSYYIGTADKFSPNDYGTNSYKNPTSKQVSAYSAFGNKISDVGGVKTTYNYDDDGNITGIKSVTKPTWRIYAGQSLPMLTAFFKGTVQANYNFTMGDPATTGFAGYNLADAPHTDQAYETNRYWTDENGNVVTTYNGQIAAATPTTYWRDEEGNIFTPKNENEKGEISTTFASLVGNGITYNAKTSANADRGTDASSSYALYSSGQLGYDVAGSNFTVEKRKVVGTSSTSEVTIPASKVYDGKSDFELNGDISTSFSDPTGITGIVDGDDVSLSGHVKGKMYESKTAYDTATDKTKVEVVDVNTTGKYYARLTFDSLALSGTNKDNYELTVKSSGGKEIGTEGASITPKALYVSLNKATGIDKTYDGKTAITNSAYGWSNVVKDESGKIKTERIHKGETEARADDVSIVIGTDADNPVTYSNKNAGEQDVVYTGLALTGKEKNNYVLKYKEGGTEVGPVANGTITGKGTISPKTINMSSAIAAVSKNYDGKSSYTGDIVIKETQPADGIVSGDTIAFSIVSGTGKFLDSSSAETIHAGGDHAATQVQYTVSVTGADAANYKIGTTTLSDGATVAGVISSGTINKATLQVSYDTTKPVLERVYNGESTVADGSTIKTNDVKSRITVDGWIDDDDATYGDAVVAGADYVTNGVANGHVAFANDQVQKKDIKFMLGTLDDYKYEDANGNEITSITATNAGKITQKAVTVNFAEINKTYDGTTALTAANLTTVKNNSNLKGVLAADAANVTLNTENLQGVYKSKNVADYAGADGKVGAVTYTNVSVNDKTDNHDYIVPSGEMYGDGYITAREVTADNLASVFNAISKEYDKDADVKHNGVKEKGLTSENSAYLKKLYVDGVDDDNIAFTIAEAVYASKNVKDNTAEANNNVTYTLNLNLTDEQKGNYNFTTSSTTGGNSITVNTDGSVEAVRKVNGVINPHQIDKSKSAITIKNENLTKIYNKSSNLVNNLDDQTATTELVGDDLVVINDSLLNSETGVKNVTKGKYVQKGTDTEALDVVGDKEVLYALALSGNDSDTNYVFVDGGTKITTLRGNGAITPRTLTVTANTSGPEKDYDGREAVNNPIGYVSADFIDGDTWGGDTDNITGKYGTKSGTDFTPDANVSYVLNPDKTKKILEKDVQYTGFAEALTNNNYQLADNTVYGKGKINPLQVTSDVLAGTIEFNDLSKEYDGYTNLLETDIKTYIKKGPSVQLATGDVELDYTVTSSGYDSANAGNNRTVGFTFTLAGQDTGNYTITGGNVEKTANTAITPRVIVANVNSGLNTDKIYDADAVLKNASSGGSAYTGSQLITFTRKPGDEGDALCGTTTNDSTATYESENVKYNGTTPIAQTITFNAAVSDAANYKIIDANGKVLNDGGTASPENALTSTGTISPRDVVVAFKDVTKVYDGTKAVTDVNRGLVNTVEDQILAADTGKAVFTTLDDAYYAANAAYESKDVKDNREANPGTVHYNNLTFIGEHAGNYRLTDGSGNALTKDSAGKYTAVGKGVIAPFTLTDEQLKAGFTLSDGITKTYDATFDVKPVGTGTLNDYLTKHQASDGTHTVTLEYGTDYTIDSAKYKDKNAGTDKIVNYEIKLADKENFGLANDTFTTTTDKATITKKKVSLSVDDLVRTYNGSADVVDGTEITKDTLLNAITVNSADLQGDDQLTLNKDALIAVYAAKTAGGITYSGKDVVYENDDAYKAGTVSTKNVELSGLKLADVGTADVAKNYEIDATYTAEGKGKITPYHLDKDDINFAATRNFDGTAVVHASDLTDKTIKGVNSEKITLSDDALAKLTGTYGADASGQGHNIHAGDKKSVYYNNVDQALTTQGLTENGSTKPILARNYTIDKTAYFAEAEGRGEITPLAITAGAVKSKWSNVEKVYDGTSSVNEPTKNMELYIDGSKAKLTYTLENGGANYYSSDKSATVKNVGDTYDVGYKLNSITINIPGGETAETGDYTVADELLSKTWYMSDRNNSTDDVTASITPRTIYVKFDDKPEISRAYNGDVNVDNPWNVSIIEDKGDDTGVIVGDSVKLVDTGRTVAFDGADVAYDADGNVTTKTINYKGLKLTNANYKLVAKDAKSKEETDGTLTLEGVGKITPREIMVDIKNRDVSKTYDSTTDALTDGVGGTIKPFQYATDVEDTGNKNLVKATVTGGSITYDTVNNDIIYTPTAGTGVVKVHLDSANYTDKNASEAHALGVDYVLSYDSKNIVLVHNTSTDTMTTPAMVNSRMSATLRGENIGTITPRSIQIKDLYAEKVYDGTDAVEGLKFDGDGKKTVIHDVATDHDFEPGKLIGKDTVNDLGLKVIGGKYIGPNATDAAASEDATDLIEHTISDVEVNITNGNYTIDSSTPTTGKGVITRKTITANPTNVKTAPGETPTFSGSFSGFVGDDGAQVAQDFEWQSSAYPEKISEKGSYEVHAWYRGKDENWREGNYGKNYFIKTSPNTAWTVGYTDPLDPSNPDSPFNPDNPMYPSQPGSPLNPNSGVGQAIAQASKFKPDDKSYNRASHDDNIEHFGQQSAISIQYEDAGVNVGDEEAVVGKRSLIGIESAGNVVNLGDAEMHAGSIGIESNGVNLGPTAEQAAIEAGLPATESYEAVPVVATAEQEDAVVESPFLSRLRQGQSAASDESEGEVSMGISIITAEPEDEDEEEKKNRAALMARSDRETHIGIETIGGGINMAAAVR